MKAEELKESIKTILTNTDVKLPSKLNWRINKITDLLYQVTEEVIGKNDEYSGDPFSTDSYFDTFAIIVRNTLRAEQREQRDTLLGVKK